MSATIGSSTVAAILGVSPWQSPMQAWATLTGLVERTDTDDRVKRRGRIIEPALREEHARVIGVPITPGPAYEAEPLVAPAPNDWAHCRPDGFYLDGEEIVSVVEIKTTRSFDGWGDDGSADVPVYYASQVVWQMGVLSLRGAHVQGTDLVAYCPMSEEIRTYHIPYNAEQFGRMLDVVGDWYRRHVVAGEPPPVDGSEATRKVLARLYSGGEEKVVIEPTDDDRADAAVILTAQSTIAASEALADAAKARIMERIGKAGATEIKGVARWSPVKGRSGFDSKAALAADPSLTRFQTTGEPTRRLTILAKE